MFHVEQFVKIMKVKLALIFTDLHVHNYKRFDSGNSRLFNTLKVLDNIYEFCHGKGIDLILMPGDWVDQNKAIPTIVVNEFLAKVEALSEKYPNIKVVTISGNHDQATVQTLDKDAVTIVESIERESKGCVTMLDKQMFIDIGDQIRVHGIPYFEHKEHFEARLADSVKNVKEGAKNILLMHQVPSNLQNKAMAVDVDIDNERFKAFDMVFNGHIHKHEKLSENFVNVGSPIHRDAEDEGLEKGYLVADLLNPKDWRFVELKGFPQYVTVTAGELGDTNEGDFIVEIPPVIESEETDINPSEFIPTLQASEILTNYCKAVGEDKKLQIGLSFLSTVKEEE